MLSFPYCLSSFNHLARGAQRIHGNTSDEWLLTNQITWLSCLRFHERWWRRWNPSCACRILIAQDTTLPRNIRLKWNNHLKLETIYCLQVISQTIRPHAHTIINLKQEIKQSAHAYIIINLKHEIKQSAHAYTILNLGFNLKHEIKQSAHTPACLY